MRLVALPCAPRWPYPGPSLRVARMAIIIYQSRTGAPSALQSAELELSTRHCGSRQAAARERERLSCKVIPLARRLIGRHCSMRTSTRAWEGHLQPQVLRTITGMSPVQPPETFRNYHPQFLPWGWPFCILGYPCVPHAPWSLPLDRTRRLVMS